jgi:uncharacterized membrane protein
MKKKAFVVAILAAISYTLYVSIFGWSDVFIFRITVGHLGIVILALLVALGIIVPPRSER